MAARVGPYSIIRLIGGGGQGQVFLGHDRRLQRRVAIKIYRLPDARRARLETLREAQRLAGIRDPRVVQVHDVVESSDYLALVMEYVSGCSLEDVVRDRRLGIASILRIAADLCAGIAAARREQLVHGDLKASNVLISRQGRALLTDFGIAQSAPDLRTPARAGSLEALAPEQLRGGPLDVRTDLFALGRLLFRLLTGEHAFARGGTVSAAALLEGDGVSLREHLAQDHRVPAALYELVDHLLRLDPDRRPADTHPVRRVLRDLLRTLPPSEHNRLLEEARPLFRPESPGELPPRVPLQLSRQGRSRKQSLALRRRLLALWPQRGPARVMLLGMAAVGVVVVLAYWRAPPRNILVEGPHLQLGTGVYLAADVDAAYLSELLVSGLREQHGAAQVAGLLPPKVLQLGVLGDVRRAAAETLAMDVRCSALFCLLDLRRRAGGQTWQEQRVLASDAQRDQWRRSIEGALAALYR